MASKYELTFEVCGDYLRAAATGANSKETVLSYFTKCLKECEARKFDKLLVVERLAGPSLAIMDIYVLLVQLRETMPIELLKLAYVDLIPEHHEAMKFAETVSRNRGARVRLFSNEEEAVGWIRDPALDL